MSDERYDDGLVHSHAWSYAPQRLSEATYPVADARGARTPSTTANDDLMFRD
jgi:hypothetical protein